ncbi:MAG: DUF4175 family protein [Armatimonadia bacterium]
MSHHNLDLYLRRLSRLLRLVGLGRHLLLWLTGAGVLVVALCLGSHLAPSPWLLPVSGLLIAAGLLACVAVTALRPVRARQVAWVVERHYPALQESLLTAVELHCSDSTLHSPQLADTVVAHAEDTLRLITPRSILDLHRLRPLVVAAVASLALALAGVVASRDALAVMLQERSELPPAVQRLVPAIEPLPLVSGVRVAIVPPEYTGLPTRTVTTRFAALRAPVGSSITLSAAAPAVGELSLSLNDRERELQRLEGSRLGQEFRLTSDTRWQFENAYQGRHHRLNGTMRLLTDLPPVVQITYPNKDLTLKTLRPLKLLGKAYDDYGLRTLAIEYRVTGHKTWQRLQLGATGRLYLIDYEWDLSPLNLRPGLTVEYRVVATDGSPYLHFGVSRTYRVTLANLAPEEAQQRLEATREEQEQGLQRLREQAENLQRELAELQEKLQQGQELSEAQRAELQESAAQLQKQGEDLRESVANAQQDLQREGVSPELSRRLAEVQKLLNETLDKQLREAIQKLQQAARQQDPEQAQQSLQDAEEAQKQLMERLDQLLALMQQAKLEGDLAALRQEFEKLAARQQELIKQREQGANLAEQAREQRQLARDTEEAVQRTAELAEKTAEQNPKLGQQLSDLAGKLAQSDPAGKMQQASQALRSGQPTQAAGPQQQALQALQQAGADLSAAQAEVYSEMRQELSQASAELARHALELSARQERLQEDVSPFMYRGPEQMMSQKVQLQRFAARQQALTRGAGRIAERLGELAQKSPLVEPSLALQAAGLAAQSAQAEREVSGGDMNRVHDTQSEVMMGLNQLAQALLGAEEQFQQASAQMAMQEYLKRLEQLAMQQAALNQLTKQRGGGMPVPMPGGSPGKMPGGGQLGGQQGAIREALEKMLGQAGRGSGLGQQLGGVPAEMNEVEKDLRGESLGRQTYRRQENILHKMLDAQRSLYQRDREERQRLAEAPKPYKRPSSPPALRPSPQPAASVTAVQPPQQDLPLGYEELTRAYLRAVARSR